MNIQSYMKQLNTKALLAGLGVNVLGSYASSIVVSIIVAIYFLLMGANTDTLGATLYANTGFLVTMVLIMLIYCAVSAYITCKIAQNYFYLHSVAIGVISVIVIGLLDLLIMRIFPDNAYSLIPAWFNIVAYGGMIPASILGGYIATKNHRQQP